MNTKKHEEALNHLKNAEKHLKTTLLKWRPDYEQAAEEYQKAATIFKNLKLYKDSKDSLLKASECFKQNRQIFYSAKAIDNAILISKDLNELDDIKELALKAAHYFQTNGNGESAMSTLEKSGKILENSRTEDALDLYTKAGEIAIVQDNSRQAAEFLSKVGRLNVKLRRWEEAADAIRRELGLRVEMEAVQVAGRLAVALVLVQLARGDVVAAEKGFKEWGNYCDPPEIQCLESLLQAYDEEDREGALSALNNPFIKHMDVEYAILARDMPLPKGMGVEKPPKNGGKLVDENEEFEEGGLC